MLSLFFMLAATVMLWAVTARLFNRRAAFYAAAGWAVLAPTARLGAFATYDAMALCLLALAAWFATGGKGEKKETRWMLAAAATLSLANATKYASALFDPTIVSMAIFSTYPRPEGKRAWRRGAFLAAMAVQIIILLLQIGRGWYLDGIEQTTLTRLGGGTSISTVLRSSWDWTGVIIVAAAIAAGICFLVNHDLHRRLLVGILAATVLLVPAEQARIHTFTSLSKHVDFGAWFAAIAVGYGVDQIITRVHIRPLRVTLIAAMSLGVAVTAYTGIPQANELYAWPGADHLIPYLSKLVSPHDRILADNTPTFEYYLPGVRWQQWSSVYGITLPSGQRIPEHSNAFGPYRKALEHHYFKFVILAFTDKPQLDSAIATYLHTNHNYRFLRTVPFSNVASHGSYLLWEYEPKVHHHHGRHHPIFWSPPRFGTAPPFPQ